MRKILTNTQKNEQKTYISKVQDFAHFISEEKGINGNKKINGRKRHITVDSNGLLLAVWISAANKSDGTEGVELLPILQKHYTKVSIIAVDGVYKKTFENAAACCEIETQISQKTETQQGFVPQKNRWQTERSFAWLNFYRRLSKDDEKKTKTQLL